MTYETTLHSLRSALDGLHQCQLELADFCHQWRFQASSLDKLPARYHEAMEDLLARLESAAPFIEDSRCTFSQHELLANLGRWLDKAQQVLAADGAR
ncbi:MAG TPA: hypothetical protein VL051_03430 [Burkholderiaceae bacterium]|nr:hypothetical protein [Burkholderiaceae bacterium]